MSYKISDEVFQFFDELKNTNQIKSYHHSYDDEYAEILVITFNSEKLSQLETGELNITVL